MNVTPRTLGRARAAVLEVVDQILATPADRLPEPHEWQGTKVTFRHGIFHLLQDVEAVAARNFPSSEVAALAADLAAARGDLRGALLPVRDGDLDSVPADAEWTLRQTVSHVVTSQEWWAWLFDLWVREGSVEWPAKDVIPDRFRAPGQLPGTVPDLMRTLDAEVDRFCLALVSLVPRLEEKVRWNRTQVPLRFYPLRASQHLREHTIQVDKTLAMLGLSPNEQQRIARLLLSSAGRLEGPYITAEAAGLEAELDSFSASARALFG